MESCCQPTTQANSRVTLCPTCHENGRSVPIITLKSLLKPDALSMLHPKLKYFFCSTSTCEVVYYSEANTFKTQDMKVPVFQKDNRVQVPVCYCFGWTRERLNHAVEEKNDPIQFIREQVKADRCGCEVNNPQGACCLGNVTSIIREIEKKKTLSCQGGITNESCKVRSQS